MTNPQYTQDNLRITLTCPFGPDKLLFHSLKGEEALSKPFQFIVELLSQADDLDFKTIVGQNLSLTIQFPEDNQRYINGMVTRFIQAGRDTRFTRYRAELRPWLWALTLTQNCRIFQHLTVPEIIKKVFDDLGFSDYRFRLIYKYDKRDYCVQYQENAFNFVCRLMEDVGIFYFFEHQEDKHTLVLADDLGAHPDCPGINTARFLQSSNETELEDVVTHCQWSQQLVSGQYALKDFNFEIPKVNLKVQVGGPCSDYRIYEYAAGFQKRDPGEFKVRRRIESQELDYQLLDGHSHCFSFTSGYQFTLTEHPRSALNQTYVLRWLSHDLSFTHYQNSFQAFPVETPFRAPITTPKPRIVGTQTAIVTGPEGEELWTDRYGRIKVQFHWDQEGQYDENTSCWIRVNQGWAGKGWGNIVIPRIGQEVIVSFLEGDPDRPLVTGAVYNGWQQAPYPLPDEQTKSTLKSNSSKGGEGFNEVRFEDKKGKEEVYIHAQKDLNEVVENNQTLLVKANRTKTIGGNEVTTVTGDRTETIKKGHEKVTIEEGNRTILVKTGHNELTIDKGNRTVKVNTGYDALLVEGERRIEVYSGDYKLAVLSGNEDVLVSSGSALLDVKNQRYVHADKITLVANTEIELQVGGNTIKIDSSGIIIHGNRVEINGNSEVVLTGGVIKQNC